MKPIEDLLREAIGLDVASVGAASVERAVRLRMKNLGLKSLPDYYRLLATSSAELTVLIESVVVAETWFFRDDAAFDTLVRLVCQEWLPQHPGGRVRLLSLPCSTGEEPFSLAMALLDAGVPAERFHLEGVDVSARALASAKRGTYGANSFRGKTADFRSHYFSVQNGVYLLDPTVRACVEFRQGNVLSADFPGGQALYDFIFCRNLLIYLDGSAQQLALSRLERCLAPSGTLFVGPAEQPLALDHGFVSSGIPLAFACRLPNPATTPHVRASHPTRMDSSALHLMPSSPFGLPEPLPKAGSTSAGLADSTDLEQAKVLANAGLLNEAAALCEAHLRRRRDSAQAYYLLGLVRDAKGQPDAVDCYRKALYLEPGHYQTLLQMALLARKEGDPKAAQAFQRRAQRAKQKTEL